MPQKYVLLHLLLPKSIIGSRKLSASAMCMHYLRCEILQKNGQKQLKWYNFFRLSNSLFSIIKSLHCFDKKSHSIPIKRNDIDNQLFTFNWPTVIILMVNTIRCVQLKPTGTLWHICNLNDWTRFSGVLWCKQQMLLTCWRNCVKLISVYHK